MAIPDSVLIGHRARLRLGTPVTVGVLATEPCFGRSQVGEKLSILD